MSTKEALRDAEQHLAKIEKRLEKMTKELEDRLRRLREDTTWPKFLSTQSESRPDPWTN
jgi:hypothetical protein